MALVDKVEVGLVEFFNKLMVGPPHYNERHTAKEILERISSQHCDKSAKDIG
jgi:hypothetical protein